MVFNFCSITISSFSQGSNRFSIANIIKKSDSKYVFLKKLQKKQASWNYLVGDKVTLFCWDNRIIWQKSLKYLSFRANFTTSLSLAHKLQKPRVKAEAKRWRSSKEQRSFEAEAKEITRILTNRNPDGTARNREDE